MSNWRLTLVQILPAMWIWLAMFDLKAHVLHGKSFNVLRGPVLIPIGLAIVTLTVASFFLNAVFAFAISRPARVEIRPAVARARRHWVPIVISGATVGAAARVLDDGRDPLGSAVVHAFARNRRRRDDGQLRGRARAADRGSKRKQSRRDKLSTSVVGGALGATVCTPPYILGRLGILMLGSSVLFIPGIFVLAAGSHAASRRDRGGQSHKDERDPHDGTAWRRTADRTRGAPNAVIAGVESEEQTRVQPGPKSAHAPA